MIHRKRTKVVNPHLLTPNALKMAKGLTVTGMTDADWESYLLWEERSDIVEQILDAPSLTPHAAAIISGTFLAGTTDEDWQSVADYLEWAAARDKAYTNQVKTTTA